LGYLGAESAESATCFSRRTSFSPKPSGEFDLLIGCTAVAKKMIMVTENVDDFKNIKDIQIENWIDRSKA